MTPEIKHRIGQIRRGEMPEGYNRVRDSIIPSDWKQYCLGELGKNKNGLNFHREDKGIKIRILGVGDFGNLSVLRDLNALSEISVRFMPDDELLLKNGDIVFVRSNGSKELVGRNLLVYPQNEKVSFSGFCIRFRLSSDKITTAKYINLLLDNGVLKQKLQSENQGSNISNLNQSIIDNLQISIPCKGEQQKIVAILTTQDRVIELKEKRLAEKQRQKKYLMQQLLTGKKRLPGFSGKWENIKLCEVFSERKEKNIEQNLRICSVAVQKGVIDQIEHLGRSYAASDTSNYSVAHYGDIIYTKSPTGDFLYGIVKQNLLQETVAVSPLYGVFTPMTFGLGYFLHTYFQSAICAQNYLLPIVQKGAKNTINITNDTFISSQLYLPLDVEEQKAIADTFIAADREIDLLRQDIEQEKQKKKALMQLLLTGIVRVKT